MKKGFTLVELLIVVLIIGVLASIATPNFRDALVRSRTASSYANLKTLDFAIKQFITDHGVMLVGIDDYHDSSWGIERIKTVFHGVGVIRDQRKQGVLAPLTSPTPYLGHLMEDPFYTPNVKANHIESHSQDGTFHKENGLIFADFNYWYGDNDPANGMGKKELNFYYRWGEGIYKKISLNPGEYILRGLGPYALKYSSGTIYPFGMWGVIYNPSNGIRSHGMMFLHSSEGLLQ